MGRPKKADLMKDLTEAMIKRAKAKTMEDEAKRLKKAADDEIYPLMLALDLEKHEVEGVGKAARRITRGRSVNEKDLRGNMLLHGIDADEIDEIVDASVKTWETEYIWFKAG